MIKFPDKKPLVDYTHRLRSRYSETDKMGYVYYGRYLEYFEVARTEMIRHLGIPYSELENSGIMLPVIHTEIEYKKPVFYDVEMNVRVMVFDEPVIRLRTYYELTTENSNDLHVKGEVTLCFTNMETRRPCKVPSFFLDKIKPKIP